MTKEELAEIRERVELTPIGKWWWTPSSLEGNENEAQLLWVARDLHDKLYIGAQEEVAEFIPCAREDIPRLLDEVERLQDKIIDMEIQSSAVARSVLWLRSQLHMAREDEGFFDNGRPLPDEPS